MALRSLYSELGDLWHHCLASVAALSGLALLQVWQLLSLRLRTKLPANCQLPTPLSSACLSGPQHKAQRNGCRWGWPCSPHRFHSRQGTRKARILKLEISFSSLFWSYSLLFSKSTYILVLITLFFKVTILLAVCLSKIQITWYACYFFLFFFKTAFLTGPWWCTL